MDVDHRTGRIPLLWDTANLGHQLASSSGMTQKRFNQTLGFPDLPLCSHCMELLKIWAETDPRSPHARPRWEVFENHLGHCHCQMEYPAAA